MAVGVAVWLAYAKAMALASSRLASSSRLCLITESIRYRYPSKLETTKMLYHDAWVTGAGVDKQEERLFIQLMEPDRPEQ